MPRFLKAPEVVSGRVIMWLAITAFVVATIAAGIGTTAIVLVSEQASRAADTSRASCQRTRRFGPPLADYYERDHVLSRDQIQAYRETIPGSCPK